MTAGDRAAGRARFEPPAHSLGGRAVIGSNRGALQAFSCLASHTHRQAQAPKLRRIHAVLGRRFGLRPNATGAVTAVSTVCCALSPSRLSQPYECDHRALVELRSEDRPSSNTTVTEEPRELSRPRHAPEMSPSGDAATAISASPPRWECYQRVAVKRYLTVFSLKPWVYRTKALNGIPTKERRRWT